MPARSRSAALTVSASVPQTRPTRRDAPPWEHLLRRLGEVRAETEALCAPLSPEDAAIQSSPEASPAKWHLAHTTWFFETFLLRPHAPGYRPFDPHFEVLFNSYYHTVGDMFPRPRRGVLSRPSLERVRAYRAHVDEALAAWLAGAAPTDPHLAHVLEVGLHHEQQHQELLLTDILHLLSCNPTAPAYRSEGGPPPDPGPPPPMAWHEHPGGVVEIGHGGGGFAYDNEGPRHRVHLRPFALGSRPVTCAEYLEFMADGGYGRFELWLAEGWDLVRREGWRAPLHWRERDGLWVHFTLDGEVPLEPAAPVGHLSYHEAHAFAAWAGARLPTEAEWEVFAAEEPVAGNLAGSGALRPRPARADAATRGPAQIFGDVWEWTASPYTPYPGYAAEDGALGEYNGKFMCNQMVLRGGSCATPEGHVRPTYRNFFHPHDRWQFAGLRLARWI